MQLLSGHFHFFFFFFLQTWTYSNWPESITLCRKFSPTHHELLHASHFIWPYKGSGCSHFSFSVALQFSSSRFFPIRFQLKLKQRKIKWKEKKINTLIYEFYSEMVSAMPFLWHKHVLHTIAWRTDANVFHHDVCCVFMRARAQTKRTLRFMCT